MLTGSDGVNLTNSAYFHFHCLVHQISKTPRKTQGHMVDLIPLIPQEVGKKGQKLTTSACNNIIFKKKP